MAGDIEFNTRTKTAIDFYRALLEPVLMSDEQGVIVDVNDYFTDLLGYERSEIVGEGVDRLLPGKYRLKHRDHIRKFF